MSLAACLSSLFPSLHHPLHHSIHPDLLPSSLPPLSLLPSSLSFILRLTSANLTPIFSLFTVPPSPPLHFIIGSVLFQHSFLCPPPLPHFQDDAWLHISVWFRQPHTHLFLITTFSVHNVIVKVNSWWAGERIHRLEVRSLADYWVYQLYSQERLTILGWKWCHPMTFRTIHRGEEITDNWQFPNQTVIIVLATESNQGANFMLF